MTESFFPLTALSEVQRAQALERFTIIRPALEDGVSQAQVARASKKAESTIRPAAPGGRRDPADGRGPGPHPDTGRCAESADLQSGVGGLPRARSHPDQHQGEFDLLCLRSLVGLGPLGPALHGAGGLPGAGPRGQRHAALRRARDRRPRADGRGDGAAHRARGMNSGSDLGKDAPYPSGLLGADRLSPIPRVRWRPNPHA
jgi:hypothetical protein